MLQLFFRKKIELVYGSPVKYSKDCLPLITDIQEKTHCRISPTTIMRALGIVHSNVCPRMHTLDIIANYIGYESWQKAYEGDRLSGFVSDDLSVVNPLDLNKNQLLKIKLTKMEIELLLLEGNTFIIVSSKNTFLLPSDIIRVIRFEKNFFLVCESIFREGKEIGPWSSDNMVITQMYYTN